MIRICIYGWIGLALWSCAGGFAPIEERPYRPESPPKSYLVVRGDTLYAIAWRYGLDYRDIAAWNRLPNPDLIYAGQRLKLRSNLPDDSPPESSSLAQKKVNYGHGLERQAELSAKVWDWPTEGQIVHDYRPDIPGRKGIQIAGDLGQSVRAAFPGQVVYSGSGLPGYGRLIIVKHEDNLLSAYGYLSKILVQEGQNVQLGQPIAELGAGSENRPVLHFEIRRNGEPVNPLDFLPS